MEPVPDQQLDPPEGAPLYCWFCGEQIVAGYEVETGWGWTCDTCDKELDADG